MESGRSSTGYGLFAVAVTLGGTNFLAVRLSNRELDPFWGAGLRFSLAAAIFVIIVLALRLPWPRGRQLFLSIVNGLLGISLFYALMYWALVRVTAGAATVVLALVPLVTLLLAAAQGTEQLSRRALIGSMLAVAGIAWMTFTSGDVILPVGALVAMLAATVCVGQGVIVSKRISANHPAVTNAVSLTTGAVSLLVLSALSAEQWALPRGPDVMLSLLYLVTLGSVGLFVLVLLVVRRWTASATSYMFVLFPVVTMLLGSWLLDEPVTAPGVVGALLVMVGVWFGALAPSQGRTEGGQAVDRTAPVLESG